MTTLDLDGIDLTHGLTSAQVVSSAETHGTNRYTPLPTKSVFDFLKEAFSDLMIQILLVAAVVSIGFGAASGEYIDGIAIMVAVLVVAAVGTYNQLRAQKDFTDLESVSNQEEIRVIRDGHVNEIHTDDLVVGDVVEINVGDILPADVAYRGTAALHVSEAQITGEPETTKEPGEDIFASSQVLDGSGRAVVANVGDQTVFGKIRSELTREEQPTPLEERLDSLAKRIGLVGSLIAILTLVSIIASAALRDEVATVWKGDWTEFLIHAFTIAVTIVVVTVPEGLPLAVTLCLAHTTRKMAEEQALVRELSACETMGAATIVCSDKTGTLTEGRMRLSWLHSAGRRWLPGEELQPELTALLSRAIAVNSTADLVEQEDGETTVAGNSTEGALLLYLSSHGVSYLEIRDAYELTDRVEFNSKRKYMLSAIAVDGRSEVHLKGAPEMVLERCDHIFGEGGPELLDDASRQAIRDEIADAAGRGYRTLALAVGGEAVGLGDEEFALFGIAVLADAMRAEVPHSVEHCKHAGVRVMMITGDVADTALEIGRQAGIAADEHQVLTGAELQDMSDDELSERLVNTTIVARALPEDKRRITTLLQGSDEVVAITGDGVNDAPALFAADVGFSMGSGSKVAREASDIVIVDDDFTTIVRAIRWGRSVFENIRKFLQFQLTVNLVALALAFSAAMFGFGTPLTAVQLLWVNLIMDSLAALALTLEPPTDKLYEQPPHGRHEPLLSRFMSWNVVAMGIYMFLVLWVVLGTDIFIGGAGDDPARTTLVFNVFVMMQIFNSVNARVVRPGGGPFKNLIESRWFIGIMGSIAVLQVFIVQFGGRVFSTSGLTPRQWAVSIAIGATTLVVGFVVRMLAGLRR